MTDFKTFHIEPTFLPLQGPNGVRPKAPAVGAWQSPGYTGLTKVEALLRHKADQRDWFGMRCDGLVVIDCDNQESCAFWLEHTGLGPSATWLRRTPRGFHFIYRQVAGSPDAPYAGVFPGIDIRSGRTSQIVYYASGYHDLAAKVLLDFQPHWLPELSAGAGQLDRTDESWDEMPEGRGNNTMTAIAGAMRKQGMSLPAIAKCLGAINRITMTADPMPSSMIVDIAKSVSRYKAKPDIDIEVVDE
jgi:hypothetical protein